MQLLPFNEESLVSASHQLALTLSLLFVHTARRYYRLSGLVRVSDWPWGRETAPGAGKLDEPGRLEEVKVVTRSPLVNQRRDHYRVRHRLYDPVNLIPSCLGAARSPPRRPARRWPLAPCIPRDIYLTIVAQKVKTLNNGSLGSGIDEERSEPR